MAKQTFIHGLTTYRKAIDATKETIERETKYGTPEQLAVSKAELKEMYLNARTMGDLPHIKAMAAEVEKRVEHYFRDFYYYDLEIFAGYKGRAFWYVGDCGTHVVFLTVDTEVEIEAQRSYLGAVEKNYGGRYARFMVDTEKQTLKRLDKLDLTKVEFTVRGSVFSGV